jgi:hypothetical protein
MDTSVHPPGSSPRFFLCSSSVADGVFANVAKSTTFPVPTACTAKIVATTPECRAFFAMKADVCAGSIIAMVSVTTNFVGIKSLGFGFKATAGFHDIRHVQQSKWIFHVQFFMHRIPTLVLPFDVRTHQQSFRNAVHGSLHIAIHVSTIIARVETRNAVFCSGKEQFSILQSQTVKLQDAVCGEWMHHDQFDQMMHFSTGQRQFCQGRNVTVAEYLFPYFQREIQCGHVLWNKSYV